VVHGWQVNKRKGEEYKLLWKDSPEFVRLATKCNALIVPFAAIGGARAICIDTFAPHNASRPARP
jgi:hypothetical protein